VKARWSKFAPELEVYVFEADPVFVEPFAFSVLKTSFNNCSSELVTGGLETSDDD
jgi:hypothetical protein